MSTYVIGIGSQRCGTTLLHALLDAAPGLAMHPVKELHYFDVQSGLRPLSLQRSRARSRLYRQLLRPHILLTGSGLLAARTNLRQARAEIGNYSYLSLFGGLADAEIMLGEVTPEYMLLPADGVRHMREVLGDAHIILLTRDPLQRVLSSLKLRLDAIAGYPGPTLPCDSEQHVSVFLEQNPGWIIRQQGFNNYQSAQENFQREFSNVLTLDYQQLIDERAGRKKLEQFLGVAFDEKRYHRALNRRHNAHHQPLQLSPETVEQIRTLFELD